MRAKTVMIIAVGVCLFLNGSSGFANAQTYNCLLKRFHYGFCDKTDHGSFDPQKPVPLTIRMDQVEAKVENYTFDDGTRGITASVNRIKSDAEVTSTIPVWAEKIMTNLKLTALSETKIEFEYKLECQLR